MHLVRFFCVKAVGGRIPSGLGEDTLTWSEFDQHTTIPYQLIYEDHIIQNKYNVQSMAVKCFAYTPVGGSGFVGTPILSVPSFRTSRGYCPRCGLTRSD